MINNVRNTVLSLLSKENRGYLTPIEFNLYSDMAQLYIFEKDFDEYSKSIVKQNNRLYNSEYSDTPKFLRERIDRFVKYITLSYNSTSKIFSYSDTDVYKIMNLEYNGTDIEEVSKMHLNKLKKVSSTTVDEKYPIYTRLGNDFNVLPTTIVSGVTCLCIKRPKVPNWTYTTVNGNPMFNQSAGDYQDFEIHPSQEVELIIKILGYAGLTITSEQVMQFSKNEEILQETKKQ